MVGLSMSIGAELAATIDLEVTRVPVPAEIVRAATAMHMLLKQIEKLASGPVVRAPISSCIV